MATVIIKKDVIITKYSVQESMAMVSSQPYLKVNGVSSIMNSWNMTQEEAEKTMRENEEWARS